MLQLFFSLDFHSFKRFMFWGTIFRYGRQVSANDLNELYGESRANGLGHEVQYSQLYIYHNHTPLVYSQANFVFLI